MKFEIQGFPTIVVVKDGKYYQYVGNRTEENIVKWIENQSYLNLSSHNLTKGRLSKYEKFILNLKSLVNPLDELVEFLFSLIGINHLPLTLKVILALCLGSSPIIFLIIICVYLCLFVKDPEDLGEISENNQDQNKCSQKSDTNTNEIEGIKLLHKNAND